MPDIYAAPSKPPPGTQMHHGLAICQGMVGAWPLTDGVGVIAHNAVPGGLDGQLGTGPAAATKPQAPLWTGNEWGTCLNFREDTAACFVNIPIHPLVSILGLNAGRWVFSCMAFGTLFGNINSPVILSGGSSLSNTPVFQIGVDSSNRLFLFARDDAAVSVNPTGQGNLFDGRRHSYAFVADGSNIYGYVDGVFNVSASIAALGKATMDRLTIGNTAQSTQGEQWRGTIDQALLWNRAIGKDEILTLHRAPFSYLRVWNT